MKRLVPCVTATSKGKSIHLEENYPNLRYVSVRSYRNVSEDSIVSRKHFCMLSRFAFEFADELLKRIGVYFLNHSLLI